MVLAKRAIAGCLLGLLACPAWADNEQYWFARGGMLVVNQPQMEPMKAMSLTYGYNVSRDASFEVDLLSGVGEGVASQGNSSLGVTGVGGFIAKRVVLSQVAYLKGKMGGVMLDKRFAGDLSDESETRFRAAPGVGAGALFHGQSLRRLVLEAEISYLDSETYLATVGLHAKF